jgi:ribonuclease VapC
VLLVDTSIIIGLIRNERDVTPLASILVTERCGVPVPVLVEAALWITRNIADQRSDLLESLLRQRNVEALPFEMAAASLAIDAVRRFGRGSGHPARLNFGDCMVYGHAKALGLPLLFKGGDFGLTDVKVHPASVRG